MNNSLDQTNRPLVRTWLATLLVLGVAANSLAAEPKLLSSHADAVYDVEFSPLGKLMASGSYDRSVKLWAMSDQSILATLQHHKDQVFRVAFSHDGKSLATASGDGTTIIWDLATRQQHKIFDGHDVAVIDVAYSVDDQLVATAGSQIRLWDANRGEQVWSIPNPQTFFAVAFSPDQKILACGTTNLIRLCDVSNGESLGGLAANHGMVYQLDFSPDGRLLASAHADGTLTLWDINQKKKLSSCKADATALFAADFSPDGTHLVTGGRERVIRIWAAENLQMDKQLYGPQETVLCVSYSPDGKSIASGSYAGNIHWWTLDPQ